VPCLTSGELYIDLRRGGWEDCRETNGGLNRSEVELLPDRDLGLTSLDRSETRILRIIPSAC
jgi:hypothetical protein